MKIYRKIDEEDLVEAINSGSVGLLPTDTIYGLSCSAYARNSVEQIYDIKGRNKKSPLIILISEISDLKKFRIDVNKNIEQMLTANWPGSISFILPVSDGYDFLTRGATGLAFRLPANQALQKLIQITGPLVSTSANPSGLRPAESVEEAKEYFGEQLDYCVDVGTLVGSPSTLVDLTGGRPTILRQGETPFKL